MSDYTKILFCLTALISGVLSEEIVEQQQQIEKLPETTQLPVESEDSIISESLINSSAAPPTINNGVVQEPSAIEINRELRAQLKALKKFFNDDKVDLEKTTNALGKFQVENFDVATSGEALEVALKMGLIEDAKRMYDYRFKMRPKKRQQLMEFQIDLLRAVSNWTFSVGTLSDLAYLIDAYKNEDINLDLYREEFRKLMQYEVADDESYFLNENSDKPIENKTV